MSGFPEQVKQDVFEMQNGFCRIPNCCEPMTDCHHRISNSKVNNWLYPIFVPSVLNAVGICRNHHSGPEKEQFKITEKEAEVYESFLAELNKETGLTKEER